MRKFTFWLSALFLVFGLNVATAQTKVISGKVTDASGALPGVSVVVKGTTKGTQTDFDGKYSLSANVGDVLVFSFVGMETASKTVGATNVINVTMAEGALALQEVVVVGYGVSTKQSFTGTATKIDSKSIQGKSTSNISQALAGEIAGVQVLNTSGQPGTSAVIRIRGLGSVNGNQAPLYVVDGIPYTADISSINPSDIESTVVLKDATATAIYGAMGANGVILIATRKGKADQSSIEVDVKTGINVDLLPRSEVIKSPEEYIAFGWEGLYNRSRYGLNTTEAAAITAANTNLFSGTGINIFYNMWNAANGAALIDPVTKKVRPEITRKYSPENWEDYAFQQAIRTEANLKLSGGSGDTNYYTSVGYLNDVGYSINSDYKRISTRLNLNHKVKDWLAGSMNIGYSLSKSKQNGQSSDSGSVFWFVDNIPSIYPLFLRNPDGTIKQDLIFGGNQYDYGSNGRGFGALTNAIADAKYQELFSDAHRINISSTLNANITKDITFENTFGMQYTNSSGDNLRSPFYGSAASQGGSINKNKTETLNINFTQLLRYKKAFGNHSVQALLAHEANSWKQEYLTVSKNKLANPFSNELNNAVIQSPAFSYTNDYKLESYFGQANYSYNNTYFLSSSVRRDGSSRFLNEKWGTFWSVGLGWVATEESFLKNQKIFDFLKFKASYGLTGDQAGVGYYPGLDLYEINNINDGVSLSLSTVGNPELTWETAKMLQVGTEMSLGKYFDINLDYYIKNTDDLIFDRRVGPSIGYAIIKVNDGQLRNSGFEFDVTSHLISNKDFSLDINFNGEMLKNEMKRLPIDPATSEEKIIDIDGLYGRSIGRSLYDFYIREWAGVDPTTGRGSWNLYYNDVNGDGIAQTAEKIVSLTPFLADNPTSLANIKSEKTYTYSEATLKYVEKSAIAKVRGAFNLKTRYKDFDFAIQFLYSLGGYSYDGAYATLMNNTQIGNNNFHIDIRNRWQNPGDITDVPRLTNGYDTNVASASTRFIRSSDFLSVNNLRVGYSLPMHLLKSSTFSAVNFSLTGDNLLLLTDRKGFNPTTSISGASNMYTYSPLSTITFGVRAKF